MKSLHNLHSKAKTEVIGNYLVQTCLTVRAADYSLKNSTVLENKQVTRILEPPQQTTAEAREIIPRAKYGMTDLNNLIKETKRLHGTKIYERHRWAWKPKIRIDPRGLFPFHNRVSMSFGKIILEDKIVMAAGLRASVLYSFHSRCHRQTFILDNSSLLWWPGIRDEVQKKAK